MITKEGLVRQMARVRRIHRKPSGNRNYYIVDANFLANWYIFPKYVPNTDEKARLERCQEWWKEIDEHVIFVFPIKFPKISR